MSRKHLALVVILAFVGGLIGGVLSNRILQAPIAHAEKASKPKKVIKAEEFQLMNSKGAVLAVLRQMTAPGFEPDFFSEGELVFFGSEGSREQGSISRSGIYLNSGDQMATIQTDYVHLTDGKGGQFLLNCNMGNPFFSISDKGGFTTQTGSADLSQKQTGATIKRSAASITMFKGGKVIWQAP